MNDIALHSGVYQPARVYRLRYLEDVYRDNPITAKLLREVGTELGCVKSTHLPPVPPDDHRWLACLPFALDDSEVLICFPEHVMGEGATVPIWVGTHGYVESSKLEYLIQSVTDHISLGLHRPRKSWTISWIPAVLIALGITLLVLTSIHFKIRV